MNPVDERSGVKATDEAKPFETGVASDTPHASADQELPPGEVLVVTGLSGAGLSTAGDVLEDLGWYVIENIPPAMFTSALDLAGGPDPALRRVALVSVNGPFHDQLAPSIEALRRPDVPVRVVFLDATTDVLVRRFEGTRRRHPVPLGMVGEAIEHDRELLGSVRAGADFVIDTSNLNVHQLRDRIVDLVGRPAVDVELGVSVLSFGYTHGIPLDADMVLDVRFLPNPHWQPELREKTGEDPAVSEFVLSQALAEEFLERVDHLLDLLLPAYRSEGKSYLQLAIGCTGGRHRSVAIAEEIGRRLTERGLSPVVRHRDRRIPTTGR